jgi:putative zinc finger/helix-turn-helix YgiT family protein
MSKCEKCGGALKTTLLREYRNDQLIGIPYVVLYDAVEEERCVKCGHVAAITIPKLSEMISSAAVLRAKMPQKLSGPELRALRKALGMSAKQQAELFGVREETVSRWETGAIPIGPANEKLFRISLITLLEDAAPGIEADPQDVISMTIHPLRRGKMEISLCYGPVRIDRRRVRAWTPSDRAAA